MEDCQGWNLRQVFQYSPVAQRPLLAGSRHSEIIISKVLNFRFRPEADVHLNVSSVDTSYSDKVSTALEELNKDLRNECFRLIKSAQQKR